VSGLAGAELESAAAAGTAEMIDRLFPSRAFEPSIKEESAHEEYTKYRDPDDPDDPVVHLPLDVCAGEAATNHRQITAPGPALQGVYLVCVARNRGRTALLSRSRTVLENRPTAKSCIRFPQSFVRVGANPDFPYNHGLIAGQPQSAGNRVRLQERRIAQGCRSSTRTSMAGSGRGAVWLARLNGVQEVAGSNPVAPT
jgi:hypothetical protein